MRYFKVNLSGSQFSIWALREDGMERCIRGGGTGVQKWHVPRDKDDRPIESFNTAIEISEADAMIELI